VVDVLTAALTVLVAAQAAAPEDWSRFRGPNGSGVSATAELPVQFGPDVNVVWKTALPFGHSSPILSGDRIYVTALRDDRLLTIALDRQSGRILWERDAPRGRREKLDGRNGPAAPSPAADRSNVYVFFPDYGLLSYDRDGRERWRVPLGPFNNIYGMGASPVLVDGLVVLVCDQSTDSYIAAFSMRDGALRWKTPRREARSGHSTPILYQPGGGGKQILVAGSFLLSAYDATSGERIWWVRGLSFEMKSTPVVLGDTLFINGFGSPENQPGAQRTIPSFEEATALYDDGDRRLLQRELPREHGRTWIDLNGDGTIALDEWDHYRAAMASENGLLAIRLGGRGDLTGTNIAWKYHKSVPQLPSPIVYKGVLYMVNDGGIVTTFEPATGAVIAQGRISGAVDRVYASPVAAGDKVLIATETGKVAVLPTDGSLTPLAVNDLQEDIYATPAISGDRLFVRTRGTLYCFAVRRPGLQVGRARAGQNSAMNPGRNATVHAPKLSR
jgi:outer membrane protein assembly factor BamB